MNYYTLMESIQNDKVEVIKNFVETHLHKNANAILKADGETLLLKASLFNAIKVTNYLLLAKAEVDKKDNEGYTPLMWANSVEMINLLIAHQADINLTNAYKHNALIESLKSQTKPIIISKHLIDLGINLESTKKLFDQGVLQIDKEKEIQDYIQAQEEKIIITQKMAQLNLEKSIHKMKI